MAASLKAKKVVINKLYEQFKLHGLTTDITYDEYVLKVGSKDAIARRTLAKGWRGRWPVAMSQLKNTFPDVNVIINPIKENIVSQDSSIVSGLEALKALSAAKEDLDG